MNNEFNAYAVYDSKNDRTINTAITGALELSRLRHATVGFEFNNVSMVVTEESRPAQVLETYAERLSRINMLRRQSAAY